MTQDKEIKYEPPKLTRYGTVASLTSLVLKCSFGDDHQFGRIVNNPNPVPPNCEPVE